MRNRGISLVVVLAVALTAFALAACGIANAAPPSQGGTPVPTTPPNISDIGTSGTGRVFAKPDTAIASVGVELTATTLAAATSDANTRMTAVLSKLKSLGVDEKDITTVSYNVNPITSNPKEGESPHINGYHVSNVVQVKIRKLADVGTILDGAIAAGANTLNSLFFTIDDPATLQTQARTQAVADATAKAKTLASAAGVKLGQVISITEGVSVPRPIFDRSLAAPAGLGGGAPGPVETGQLEISVTVEMHFQIAQ